MPTEPDALKTRQTPMRSSRWRSCGAAVALALATACHDDGPTAPTTPPPATSEPTPLAGQWHGRTASYPTGQCGAERVVASVGQLGTHVGISIQTTCIGVVSFVLNYASPALTGKAKIGPCRTIFGPATNGQLETPASGTASQTHIHLEAPGFGSPLTSCSRPAVMFELDR